MNYLSAENLSKSFGEQKLFEGLTFGLARGDKTAFVARNGTGKTTLLRILMGKMDSDTGEFTFRKGIKTAFLEQSPELDDSLTIDQLILSANTPVIELIQRYKKALDKHSLLHTEETTSDLEELTNEMDHTHAWDYERRLKQLLDLFRITNTSQMVSSLSGGEKKRVALALVLLDEPELLILDEPTNHLDIDMIEWLERYLSTTNLTLLMVTHDRYFLDRVCNRIMELSLGQLYQYQGNYELFLQKRAEREEVRKVESEKATQLMKKELEWLRRMPKARTTKSKSRIDAFDSIREKARLETGPGDLRLQVKSPRLGGKIMELEGIRKTYDSVRIIDAFSYKFLKGDRVGVIGRNGTGKTTFLNVISQFEKQDAGTIDLGETVVMGYYRQMGQEWDHGMRVIDAVKEIAEVVQMEDGRTISASQFLEHFLFTPESQYKRIAKLSGGELRRLHLLTVLIKNPNFLILDEPTNDLDLFALNKLEEFLFNFKGVLVIVSHDRYFLDKLTDHLFIFEGEGRIKDHYGSYQTYRQLYEDAGSVRSKVYKVESGKSDGSIKSIKSKAGGQKTRLTFREQQEYKRLEPEIEALEQEKTALEAELSTGRLDYALLDSKSKRVAEIIEELDTRLERWMELGEYL
ncbi:MAG: ABC-F family ATP-binding cassette domain-containing protein [Bacteroidales bacterium]